MIDIEINAIRGAISVGHEVPTFKLRLDFSSDDDHVLNLLWSDLLGEHYRDWVFAEFEGEVIVVSGWTYSHQEAYGLYLNVTGGLMDVTRFASRIRDMKVSDILRGLSCARLHVRLVEFANQVALILDEQESRLKEQEDRLKDLECRYAQLKLKERRR